MPSLRRCRLLALAALLCWTALPGPADADELPPPVLAALRQAQVEPAALGVLVQAVDAPAPRLAWRAAAPLNPASMTKLVTSMAALDTLGPGWQWQTPVWLNGRLDEHGSLDGELVIQGSGDPRLSSERVWQLMRRLRQMGLREVRGPLRLDRSLFAPSTVDPGAFDAEPWRVGNAQPDALLLHAKASWLSVRPDPAGKTARISAEPELDPVASVPLTSGPCGDWRGALKLQWAAGSRPRFAGSYPASCGEQGWWLADPEPASHTARLLRLIARETGLALSGEVIDGPAPAAPPDLRLAGPTLAEALRDMNKYSSNLIAQQVLLSVAHQAGVPAPVQAEAAAEWLQQWADLHAGPGSRLRNGSGLSRDNRISPGQLATLLRWAWGQPWMPELLASLPVAGVDGTLSRQPGRFGAAAGRAHLKTGSLRDVSAIAGIVQGASGRRWVLVAIVNHAQAASAHGALDALLRWVAADTAAATPSGAAGRRSNAPKPSSPIGDPAGPASAPQ